MDDILDILNTIECHELSWARLAMSEVTEEMNEHNQLLEEGKSDEALLWYSLKRQAVKMDLVLHALHGIEQKIKQAQEIAKGDRDAKPA